MDRCNSYRRKLENSINSEKMIEKSSELLFYRTTFIYFLTYFCRFFDILKTFLQIFSDDYVLRRFYIFYVFGPRELEDDTNSYQHVYQLLQR